MNETLIVLKGTDNEDIRHLDGYLSQGGYQALRKALAMERHEVIEEVKRSGLRGRGGAGFPAGVKWSFVPHLSEKPVYLICNADEGEPGTFKDRVIMEKAPHRLLEGMLIASYATGARQAFIYIRGEFMEVAELLEKALEEARQGGFLGKQIAGSDFELEITVYRGAGSYVCGDETALIESLEGKRGHPRLKPPFPAEYGLYGCPTVVNNVETLCCIPWIVQQGGEAFAQIGSRGNTGTRLYAVSGDVKKPGCYEYPLGVSLLTLIHEAAGGLEGDQRLKAVIPGGLSAPILTADEADIAMDFDSLASCGSMLGSAGVIVLGEKASIPSVALQASVFFAGESCGQCTPCREGTAMIERLLRRHCEGMGGEGELEILERLCRTIEGSCLCAMGDAAARAILTMLTKFRDEFRTIQ
ncbi:MAG: NADH-quinone oxidoreductase subunit NuoF [Candidatus Xenobiia bacterium LiM19]